MHHSGNENIKLIKIPLQFEYLFPTALVRPKIDFGLNMFHSISDYGANISLTAATSVGVLAKLTNFLYLDLNASSDLFAFNYYTPFFLSLSLQAGLYVKF